MRIDDFEIPKINTCLNCGSVTGSCLCQSCRKDTDIDKLCRNISTYKAGSGENQNWESIIAALENPGDFKNIIFLLTEGLPYPQKEYLRVVYSCSSYLTVPRERRPWLYGVYADLNNNALLNRTEQNNLDGIVLGALYMDYSYREAEKLAAALMKSTPLSPKAYENLIDFYSKTRRYDRAAELITKAWGEYHADPSFTQSLGKLRAQNEKYRTARESGKKEYMPAPRESKAEVQEKYLEFLKFIGIEAAITVNSNGANKAPAKISEEEYPAFPVKRTANFNNFVAYDFETTGLSSAFDCIIEVGAVKVVDGKVVDSAEFTFQEFVRPYRRSISPQITQITGITKEDTANARPMWEVIPDFMKFAGDNVLVGFNNVAFDSKFLARAGRYSNLVIQNPQFDVMRYASKFNVALGIQKRRCSLADLSTALHIENPRAHRALADAITTARIFMALKSLENK